MSSITLRPYQLEAVNAVFDYWDGQGGDPLIDLATGTGKSMVLASLITQLIEANPTLPVLVLVHVRELVEQDYKAFTRLAPHIDAGINCNGLGRRDVRHQVIFASIQSVYKNPSALGARPLIIIDEAHLVPHKGEGMYRSLISAMREIEPATRVMGLTATPYRTDRGRLDRGDGALFTDIVYSYGIARGIHEGYLSPLVTKGGKTQIDVTSVARRAGEFVEQALQEAADKEEITDAAVREIISAGEDRKSWLVFCTGLLHAEHVRDKLRELGIGAEMVTSKTPSDERADILARFKAGKIRALTNMSVLTTGFDAPGVDLIAMLRPTLSASLYVQMLGRGTRIADGKANCLVLDFAGNVLRHGPVDLVATAGRKVKKKEGEQDVAPEEQPPPAKAGEARAILCEECDTFNPIGEKHCETCGEPLYKIKHHKTADDTPVVSGFIPAAPGAMPVIGMELSKHTKDPFRPSTLRVSYRITSRRQISEWLGFDHPYGSYPRRRAEEWWAEMGGKSPPGSVKAALERQGELTKRVTQILTRETDTGFTEVIKRYTEEKAGFLAGAA